MRELILTGKYGTVAAGRIVLLDDEDWTEDILKWKWGCYTIGENYYARRLGTYYENGIQKRKTILLHRVIMKIDDSNIFIDHKNGNSLDNRKENLRIATLSQNNANKHVVRGISKYLGVHKQKNGWVASTSKHGTVYRKYFRTEIEAALWYNEKAIAVHGEFANINII